MINGRLKFRTCWGHDAPNEHTLMSPKYHIAATLYLEGNDQSFDVLPTHLKTERSYLRFKQGLKEHFYGLIKLLY